jgi:hypothetical protein
MGQTRSNDKTREYGVSPSAILILIKIHAAAGRGNGGNNGV